jgi:hypothetical protein
MHMFAAALALSLFVGGYASGATIEITGGSPADFGGGYTKRDLAGAPDPWPDCGAVTNATVHIASRARVDVTYRGGADDAWALVFGDGRSFTSDSVAGDAIRRLSPSAFLALFFSNEATGVPLTDPSLAVSLCAHRGTRSFVVLTTSLERMPLTFFGHDRGGWQRSPGVLGASSAAPV